MSQTLIQLVKLAQGDTVQTCINQGLPELEAYICGVLHALENGKDSAHPVKHDRFDLWLANRKRLSVGRTVFQNLALISENDVEGFKSFFKYLDEYLALLEYDTMWTKVIAPDPACIKEKEMCLVPILKTLKETPQAFLRAPSITLLASFLNGQMNGFRALQPSLTFSPNLNEFEEWLRNKHTHRGPWAKYSWHRMIKYYSPTYDNEYRAFLETFRLMEDWNSNLGLNG